MNTLHLWHSNKERESKIYLLCVYLKSQPNIYRVEHVYLLLQPLPLQDLQLRLHWLQVFLSASHTSFRFHQVLKTFGHQFFIDVVHFSQQELLKLPCWCCWQLSKLLCHQNVFCLHHVVLLLHKFQLKLH